MSPTRIRPARPLAPMAVSGAIAATWWLVAHNSGAGWVQTLGDVVFATLLIGVFGPALVLARARVSIIRAPTDGRAGLPIELEVQASTRVRIRPAEPPGPEAFAGPARGSDQAGSRPDAFTLLPSRRGVHDRIAVDVATAAPFGLQWWTRRIWLPLAAPLHVAPRRGEPVPLPRWSDDDAGDQGRRVPVEPDEIRAARPYRAGDSRRHMHWPATAHAGELMVRELEGPSANPLTVAVRLPPDPDAAERIAERALGTVLRVFDGGAPVVLATTEVSGPVTGAVADRRAAGRRLARAVPAREANPGGAGPNADPDGADPDGADPDAPDVEVTR